MNKKTEKIIGRNPEDCAFFLREVILGQSNFFGKNPVVDDLSLPNLSKISPNWKLRVWTLILKFQNTFKSKFLAKRLENFWKYKKNNLI